MSLYGAMYSGVSGLTAESSGLSAISDNITNVNTVGYKETDVNFQTLVTQQASSTTYSPGGVQSKPRTNVEVQGLLQSTSSSTDVAISGQGFFIVNSNDDNAEGSFAYTRAGSFSVDSQGNLSNTAGYVLQGWPLTTWDSTPSAAHQTINGQNYMAAYKTGSGSYTYINESSQPNDTDLQPLNLNDIAGTAQATTSISMGANLPANSVSGFTAQTSAQIYDSLGDASNINMTWTAGASNSWSLEADPPEGARLLTVTDGTITNNVYSSVGRLDFNDTPTSGALNMVINNQPFTFDVSPGGDTGSTFHIDPTSAANTSDFTANMASAIQNAYEIAYTSVKPIAGVTGSTGVVTTALSADSFLNLSITSATGAVSTYNVNLSSVNPATGGQAGGAPATAVNAALLAAGVPAGVSASFDTTTGELTLTNATGQTVNSAGSGDLVDLSGSVTAAPGLITSPGALQIMYGTVASGSTLTVNGLPITVDGDSPTQMVTAVNAQSATTGVTAALANVVSAGSSLTINGTAIPNIAGESPAQLVNSVNGAGIAGIAATLDGDGNLVITNTTGAAASIAATGNLSTLANKALANNVGETLLSNALDSVVLTNTNGANVAITGTGDLANLTNVALGAGGTQALSNNSLSGGALTIGSTEIATAGLTRAGVVAAIAAKETTTHVGATLTAAGSIQLFSNSATAVSITANATSDLSALNGKQVTGSGVVYCNQVAGSDSLLFRQVDTNNPVSISGLTSVTDAKGASSIQQTDINTTSLPANEIATHTDGFSLATLSGTVGVSATATTGTTTPAITFNGDGTPNTINVGQIAIQWANGAEDMTTPGGGEGVGAPISLKLGDTNTSDGMTQLSGSYELSFMTANGAKFGNFSGVTVGANGVVTASFSNGVTQPIFQIPLATFIDPDGLTSLTGNVFLASSSSGSPTVRTAGQAGAGSTTGGSLESSTVDIGTQFTQMIVTQRAYSAAAKIITTANQMLDDLMQVVR